MLKGNTQKIFRIIISLLFLGIGVRYCIGGDYLYGGGCLAAGGAFAASLFLKRNGKE